MGTVAATSSASQPLCLHANVRDFGGKWDECWDGRGGVILVLGG